MSKITELCDKIDKEFTDYKYGAMENDQKTILNYDSSASQIADAAANIMVRCKVTEFIKDIIDTYESAYPLERETIVTLVNAENVLDYAADVYLNDDLKGYDLREPDGMIKLLEHTADRIYDVDKQILANAKKLDEMTK